MFISFLTMLLSVNVFAAKDYPSMANFSLENWTTCEQFLANTTFDHMKVIEADWKIFYFWTIYFDDSYNIRFSVPTPTLIDRFRVELDEDIAPPVNWSHAELFMETSVDFSGLLITTNMSGLYTLVPSLAFEYPHIPLFKFGLKYVEPGYLGVMNCRQQLCYALAPVDKMPHPDKIHEEAKRLGFRGDSSRSYLEVVPPPSWENQVPEPSVPDDDDEDEHFEIDKDSYNMDLL